MAAPDSKKSRISFSTQEPSLREQAPPSLKRAGPLRQHFEAACNELNTSSEENPLQEDIRRREYSRGGSYMVKRHQPYPELKPQNSYSLKKAVFDQAWLQEQRAALLERFEAQRQATPQQNQRSEPFLER